MNSSELIDYIHADPILFPNYQGIYSIDTIVKNIKPNKFIVINKDIASGPGDLYTEWICHCSLAPL